MTKEQIEKLKATRQAHPEYGRTLLARAAGVTEDQARAFMRSGKAQTGPGRPKIADKAATEEILDITPAASGFMLNNKNLLAKKPTDVWRGRFFALRRGMGYRIRDLSKEWGVTEDNVKQHAKSHGALRYMEDPESPAQYIAIAVHPETPKGK